MNKNKRLFINGTPSDYVFVPAFKMSEVVRGGSDRLHPAFIHKGKPISGFYVSKYQCASPDGFALSVVNASPTVSVTLDEAGAIASACGEKFGLISALQWGAIALLCNKNGFLPKGNNDFGKDYSESEFIAKPCSTDGDKTGVVLTGSGPVSWAHDGTSDGIYDLNGNIWEWNAGIRLVYGEIQLAEFPQFSQNADWKAIDSDTGKLIAPNGLGTTSGSVKLDFADEGWQFTANECDRNPKIRNCLFNKITIDKTIGDNAKELLLSLGLLPLSDTGDLLFYACNGAPEVVCFRGGKWSLGSNSGLFKTCLDDPRTLKGAIGIRSVYIEE